MKMRSSGRVMMRNEMVGKCIVVDQLVRQLVSSWFLAKLFFVVLGCSIFSKFEELKLIRGSSEMRTISSVLFRAPFNMKTRYNLACLVSSSSPRRSSLLLHAKVTYRSLGLDMEAFRSAPFVCRVPVGLLPTQENQSIAQFILGAAGALIETQLIRLIAYRPSRMYILCRRDTTRKRCGHGTEKGKRGPGRL